MAIERFTRALIRTRCQSTRFFGYLWLSSFSARHSFIHKIKKIFYFFENLFRMNRDSNDTLFFLSRVNQSKVRFQGACKNIVQQQFKLLQQ